MSGLKRTFFLVNVLVLVTQYLAASGSAQLSSPEERMIWAAMEGNLADVKALVEAGADVNAPSPDGIGDWTALDAAVHGDGGPHLAVAEFLVASGSVVDAELLSSAIRARDHQLFRVLLCKSQNSDLRARDPISGTPLHEVAQSGDIALLDIFLECADGYDLNDTTSMFGTPLMATLSAEPPNRMVIVSRLLAEGADPNIRSEATMQSALSTAVLNKDVELMRALAKAKTAVDPNAGSFMGQGHPFKRVVMSNDNELLAAYLELPGVDPNPRDSFGQTPLHDAASAGNLEQVRLILDKLPDVDPTAKDGFGRSPLEVAKDPDVLRILVERAKKQ